VITDFLLNWFNGLLNSAVDTLPTSNPLPNLGLSWITDMNYYVPLGEMFSLFLVIFALGGPFIATSLIVWVIVGVLRGGATKA